jgi:hypothetical protein
MHTHRLRPLLISLIPLLLATGLYAYSLRLPLFLDDGLLYLMIRDYGESGVAPFRFWGGSATYHYYRPLGFTILELDYGTDARLDPFNLHLFNLLTFVFATAAVSALATRLGRSWQAGLIAGCAFALYPFSFRAVTWVAAIFHVMVAACMTAALVCALRWLDISFMASEDLTQSSKDAKAQRRRDVGTPFMASARHQHLNLLLAWGFTFAALFSAESAVLLLPLLLLMLIIRFGWRIFRQRRTWLLLLPITTLTALFGYLFLTLPRPAAGPLTLRPETLPASLAVIGQGLIYPLVTLIRRLTVEDARTLPLLALIAAGAALGLWLAGRRWKVALIGLVWFGLAALPPALLLPTDYIKGSVHVLHLGAVGAALFWGIGIGSGLNTVPQGGCTQPQSKHRGTQSWDVGTPFMASAPQNDSTQRGKEAKAQRKPFASFAPVRLILSGLLMIGGLVVSLTYLNTRRAEALRLSDYQWRLMALVEADPTSTAVLNAPAFLAAHDRDRLFLTTSEATMFAEGSYTNHADQFRAMWGREVPGIAGFLFTPGALPPPSYTFAPYWTETPADLPVSLRDYRQIIATYFEGDHFYPAWVGGAGLPGSQTPLASFPAAGLTITEFAASLDGTSVTVKSRWQAAQAVDAIPLFQVWCDASLIAESRHPVWGGALPFTAWQPGEVQTDVRPIHPPTAFTSDCLRLSVSVLVGGQSVGGQDAAGAPLPENRLWTMLEATNP